MDNRTWWKTGVAVFVVLLGLAVAFVIAPGGSSDVSATAPPSYGGFVKYDGINGEADDSTPLIDISSLEWGASRRERGANGSTRTGGDIIVDDLIMTMAYEKSSPKLQQKCLTGEAIPMVVIELTADYGASSGPVTYLKYEDQRHGYEFRTVG